MIETMLWLAVAGVIAAAPAGAQTVSDAPLPPSSATAGAPGGDASPPPATPGGTGAAGSTLRSRLRAAVSRMPPEEVPPPPEINPLPKSPGASPGEAKSQKTPIRIPVASPAPADRVEIKQSAGRISLSAREVPLNRLLILMGQQLGVNIVCADNASTPVSVTLDQVPLEDALTAICSIAGSCWTQTNGIIHVSNIGAATKLPAEVQGRQVRVFRLDFVAAKEVETAVKAMLSPVGQSSVTESKTQDNRRTQEVVVVQDLPAYLLPIEQYVTQLDRPPRQVLIEAHVLAIDLSCENLHGVNFNYLFGHLAQAKLTVQGFATDKLPESFLFSFDGSHMESLVQALRTQSHAKTLASPKVLVLNGQEARIQIGQQLGYRVTMTTETSTLENVNFLDVGVVLRVTPRISADNQILMHVKPEVSKGEVKDSTGLPDSETTQVETDVMLPDGRGMVIGGLIDEKDNEEQQKVPVLGDIWVIGRIFQRRKITRERREIIICLLPRIVPDTLGCNDRHAVEVSRAQSPLLNADLKPYPRPGEGRLPDPVLNPQRLRDYLPSQTRAAPETSDQGQRFASGSPASWEPYYAGKEVLEGAPLPSPQWGGPAEERRQEPVRQPTPEPASLPEPSARLPSWQTPQH
jgi:type II secretory pathway component GspD/PulD (secretin)